MSNAIKAVATAMIIILIIVLIWIFLSYYRKDNIIGTMGNYSGDSNVSALEIPSGNYIEGENIINKEGLVESIIDNQPIKPIDSGDKTINKNDEVKEVENGVESSSGNTTVESSGDNESGEKMPNTVIEIPSDNIPDSENIIISSELQTSNQQKQEILTEIDKALQGLLEAVGKVEVVDEERLNATLNSEVDEP